MTHTAGGDNGDERDPNDGGGSLPGLAGLRAVDPPPSLVAGVMRRIGEQPPPGLWRWLRTPVVLELRFSRLAGALGAVGLTLALAALVATRLPAPSPLVSGGAGTEAAPVHAAGAAPAPEDRTVLVRLRLQARGARRVALAGSFNEWSTDRTWLAPAGEPDVFVATVALPPGVHEYMFVVDGRWVTDPAAEERRPDGFGRQNALLRL